MRTVVVTAIGSFSADIVIKKCRENGMRVIGCDVYPVDCGRRECGCVLSGSLCIGYRPLY